MATRRERVALELSDNWTGRLQRMRDAVDFLSGLWALPPSDRATPGVPGPQVWEGDQA